MKTCKTCAYWNFKLGGFDNGKEWGECLNPKVIEATRISMRLTDLGDFIKDDADYGSLMNKVENYTRIQFEEASFGCIYHEQDEEKSE